MEANWNTGHYKLTRITANCEYSKGIYCFQYDDQKIIGGCRDDTVKVCIRGTAIVVLK